MSISEKIYRRLSQLGSVYYGQAPQSKDLPYYIYQIISSIEEMGVLEPTELVNSQVQIDCYATSMTSAREMYRSARDVMTAIGSVLAPLKDENSVALEDEDGAILQDELFSGGSTDFTCSAVFEVGAAHEPQLQHDFASRVTGTFSVWHDIG